jgi:hypothetical protein
VTWVDALMFGLPCFALGFATATLLMTWRIR